MLLLHFCQNQKPDSPMTSSVKHLASEELWSRGTKDLSPISIGSHVLVQNQVGPKAKKWALSGTVVDIDKFGGYFVKMDGSGRISKRLRSFIREVIPFHIPVHLDPKINITKEVTVQNEDDIEGPQSLDSLPSGVRRKSPRFQREGGDSAL